MSPLLRTLLVLALAPVACQRVCPEVPLETEDPGSSSTLSPASEEEAFERLVSAERFTDDSEGYAGTLPAEVAAWRVLHASSSAAAWFERLLDEGTVPGQLFALCGLYYADRERFDEEIGRFRRIRALVPMQRGCTIGDAPASGIVDSRSPIAVRLGTEFATIREFVDAHPQMPSVAYDIVGGAYPALFAERGGWPRSGGSAD